MATFYTDSASIDVLEVSSSLLVSGTLILSGSVSSQGGYTGSLLGTASWSNNASTASFVTTAQTASFVVLAQTASFVTTAQTASFVTTAQTASFVTTAQTASYVLQAVSASFATTASFALNASSIPAFPFTGSAIISGSLRVIGSGSNILVVSGSLGTLLNVSEKTASDTRLFTVSSASINLLTVNDDKSTRISGSLIVTGSITGSLLGTASFAATSSFSVSSSFALTASFALNAGGGGGSGNGFPFTGSAVITGSLLISTGSAAFIPSPALTASEALTAGDFVNIGQGGVRRATNNDTTKQAHGYIISGYSTNDSVIVYYSGLNTSETGLVAGSRYFLGTSGGATTTPPTTAGQLSQEVGVAVSTTALLVNFGPAIVT